MASAAPLRICRVRGRHRVAADHLLRQHDQRQVDAAHAGLRREVHEARTERLHVALAQVELLLGQHDDAAALGRLVGQRRQLRGVGEFVLLDAGRRQEGRSLAVAERDGAGLVEQQHVDVAGRLDRAARGGDHVGLHHAAHAGHADGRQQRRRSWSGSGTPAARSAPSR